MRLIIRLCVCVCAGWWLAGSSMAASGPEDDESRIVIRFPKDGSVVTGSDFELEYDFQRGELADHVHLYLDGRFQQKFPLEMMGLTRGPHEMRMVAATADHRLLKASSMVRFRIE